MRLFFLALLFVSVVSYGIIGLTAEGPEPLTGESRSSVSSEEPVASEPSTADANSARFRLREGTLLKNTGGHFEMGPDGAIFIDDSDREFGVLENLNLQRVLRNLHSLPANSEVLWQVSGQVTEFEGKNYLLLSKAVYRTVTLSEPVSVPTIAPEPATP